ncbi:flagellar motor switch protein FliM [Ectobacillus polymachus]|uniref:flagellar motor switch protein FliM n=1 Tax=Ectobacillus polymachus TaxID=1508806 RepID=UPI003A8531E4
MEDYIFNNGHSLSDEEQNVKVYDFKKALRLSIEQVRVLTRIHENFAYQLSSSISALLRTIVQIEVVSVEQTLYEEFINQLPLATVMTIFEAVKQEVRVVMEVSPLMAYAAIDRLLGGPGTITEMEHMNITPIEKNVLRRLFEGFIQNIEKAWNSIIPVEFKMLDIETNPQFVQIAIPTETVIVIAFDVLIGDMKERMHLCIPYMLIEPFISKLSSYQWYVNRQKGKNVEENEHLQEKVEHLVVPVTVELGRGSITIEELLGLAVNDVIQLNQVTDAPLNVRVGEQTKFLALPGTKKTRMAVRIERVLEGDGDNG